MPRHQAWPQGWKNIMRFFKNVINIINIARLMIYISDIYQIYITRRVEPFSLADFPKLRRLCRKPTPSHVAPWEPGNLGAQQQSWTASGQRPKSATANKFSTSIGAARGAAQKYPGTKQVGGKDIKRLLRKALKKRQNSVKFLGF